MVSATPTTHTPTKHTLTPSNKQPSSHSVSSHLLVTHSSCKLLSVVTSPHLRPTFRHSTKHSNAHDIVLHNTLASPHPHSSATLVRTLLYSHYSYTIQLPNRSIVTRRSDNMPLHILIPNGVPIHEVDNALHRLAVSITPASCTNILTRPNQPIPKSSRLGNPRYFIFTASLLAFHTDSRYSAVAPISCPTAIPPVRLHMSSSRAGHTRSCASNS